MKVRQVLFAIAFAVSTLGAQSHDIRLSAEAQKGFRPLAAALHVHSTHSNGAHDIAALASFAHERNIDVLGISDSFLTRVRYGIGPLKKVLSRTMSRPAVRDTGLDRYFDDFDQAQERFKDVILIPGLEVAPYYYWRGSLSSGLELYGFDRHLLIFGMRDRQAVRNLPVIHNATWSNTERAWITVAGPATIILAGLLLLAMSLILSSARGFRIGGVALLILGGLWTYDAFPFANLPDPYSGKPDYRPFQKLIDYVSQKGGVLFWSYPEARYPVVEVGGARMMSRGEPQSLGLTDNYRGFEGLYGDRITITEPGNLWDQILVEYLRKGRRTWPSVITGIDFHSFKSGNGWYQLDWGLTILFSKDKTETAVIEALRQGRGYATFQADAARRVGLNDFAVRSGTSVAIAGETMKTDDAVNVSATIDWVSPDLPSESLADVILVRDGALVDRYRSPLPVRIERHEALEAGRHYYRIAVQLDGTRILSNPIFCEVVRN